MIFFKVCNFCQRPVVVIDRPGRKKTILATPLLPAMLIHVFSLKRNI
jgi:hypothetical protein